jgi:hypothetical protein
LLKPGTVRSNALATSPHSTSVVTLSLSGRLGVADTSDGAVTEITVLRRWLLSLPADCLVSFDVFDTMVTRIWRQPSDLFLALGTILHSRASMPLTPEAFATARTEAELAARKKHPSGETTLGEIYDRFAATTGVAPEVAQACAELELSLETRSVRPIIAVRNMARQLRAAGRRVILTSDSYLSSKHLAAVLAGAGLDPGEFQPVVSSEHRASKRVGDVYGVVRRKFPAPAYAHLGDRRAADLDNARAAGFDSRMFCGQAPTVFERALGSGRWTSPLAASSAHGAARAARLLGSAPDIRSQAIRAVGANVAAPLLCAFVAWVLLSAARAGTRRLLFLARDGQILHRLACKLAPALGLEVDCRYVYGSRQALYLPSVAAVGDDSWTWLSSGMAGRTVSQVLDRFGIAGDRAAAVCGAEFRLAQILDDPAAGRLRARLETAPISREILDIAAARREPARRYYLNEIGRDGPVAIVDVGWKGRLQLCLDAILAGSAAGERSRLNGYYFSLLKSAAVRSSGRASMFIPYADVANPVLVEVFTMADHGSLTEIRAAENDIGAEPVLAVDETAVNWGVREQQAAVSDFLDCFLAGAELGRFDLAKALTDLRDPALKNFTRFVRAPTLEQARTFGELEHSDDQGHHQASAIAGRISRLDAITLGLLGSKRSGRRISYWPQASLRRLAESDPLFALGIGLLGRDQAVNERARAVVRRAKQALRRGGIGR